MQCVAGSVAHIISRKHQQGAGDMKERVKTISAIRKQIAEVFREQEKDIARHEHARERQEEWLREQKERSEVHQRILKAKNYSK